MDIRIREIGQATVVDLKGRLNGRTSLTITEQILPVLRPQSHIFLDLADVTQPSSAGLRALLMLHRRLAAVGSHLILVGLSEELTDAMSITGFLDFFTTHKTLDSGLALLDREMG